MSSPAVVDGVLRSDGRLDVQALGGGFQVGEGLFETLPTRSGRPLFLGRHLERLASAAGELELLPTPTPASWRADLALLQEAWGAVDLAARLFLFRDRDRLRRVVAGGRLEDVPQAPARLGFADARFQGPRPLAHLKTMNYLVPRLAHAEGRRRGLDEVLFRLEDGTLLEGTRSSLFIISKDVLITPPTSLPILPGVTREVLLEIAREQGLPTREEAFTARVLETAEEVFLTASLRGVRAVSGLPGGRVLAAPGPLTQRLGRHYQEAAGREEA